MKSRVNFDECCLEGTFFFACFSFQIIDITRTFLSMLRGSESVVMWKWEVTLENFWNFIEFCLSFFTSSALSYP